MKIVRVYPEDLSKADIYKHTLSPSIEKLSEHKDEIIRPTSFVIFEDADKKDETKINTLLSLKCDDGVVYATNSETFRNMFLDIFEIMGELTEIKVVSGTSKNNREFITADLV
ncbi:MAG: hypothetical protein NC131_11500 [Roseburia sp.]|nr:hypothetical protein [Roseburia sp.]